MHYTEPIGDDVGLRGYRWHPRTTTPLTDEKIGCLIPHPERFGNEGIAAFAVAHKKAKYEKARQIIPLALLLSQAIRHLQRQRSR